MFKQIFVIFVILALSACDATPKGNVVDREILVKGDLRSGNIVLSLVNALDRGNIKQANLILPTKAIKIDGMARETLFRTLTSNPACTPWEIIAVHDQVKMMRGCPCGNVGRSDSYYLSVSNSTVTSVAIDPETLVEC